MQKCERVLVLAGVLFIITALVAFLLAAVNHITEPVIAKNLEKEQIEARKAVLPEADAFDAVAYSDAEKGITAVFQGKKGETAVGYCVQVSSQGYGGAIEMLVGIDTLHRVQSVTIVSMSETAGLGAKAQEEGFLEQYAGKSSKTPISVIKSGQPDVNEIVAISGATVTSRAVTNGVNAALAAVMTIEGEAAA